MKLLKEALVDVKRLGDETTEEDPDLDVEAGLEDADTENDEQPPPDDLDVEDSEQDPEAGDDMPERDPAEQNADADSPWGTLDSSGGMGGAGDGAEGEPSDQPPEEGQNDEVDAIADRASDDPNRQGLIRAVRGAHLVYKRESDEGSFEELWIYNVTTLQDEMTVRKAILAGTDIPPNKASSPDGSQSYKVWSAGNAEMLMITGLQN